MYPNSPIAMTPQNPMQQGAMNQMIDGRTIYDTLGVSVEFQDLKGVRLRHQIITKHVSEKGERIPIDTVADMGNDRIVGILIVSTELGAEESKSVNDSEIQLTIDNEEIFPEGFPAKLVSSKLTNTFYENNYRFNERANGCVIKGTYTASKRVEVGPEGYDIKIILWSVTKPKNK